MSINLDLMMEAAGREPLDLPLDLFYFVRHGETAGNAGGIVQFPTAPLNTAGMAQAWRAGQLMRNEPVDRTVASVFMRAFQTGQAVARATHTHLSVCLDIVERRFGNTMGQPNHDLDWAYHPPGGESMETFIARTRRGVREICEAGGIPAIVAHGGNLRVIAAGLNTELPEGSVANATPLKFERVGGRWTLGFVTD
ncbi:MAG: histidine phosphatase family protein [Alphaproteobacteria bacterium]|nr:histidine phosphatase family protein [Alphaproteobacteria bacterium]MCB9928686.1 histidine phosphatase family protein [Alphaproteobacteria bacterium]